MASGRRYNMRTTKEKVANTEGEWLVGKLNNYFWLSKTKAYL